MMFTLGVVVGLLIGAGCILWLAFHIGRRKPKKAKDSGGINVASLGDATVENIDRQWANQIAESIYGNTLFERQRGDA
jgi:hypothetical protein